MVMVVPGEGDDEDALGVGVAEGVGDGVADGVGDVELGVADGLGEELGWASVSSVSAASRMALPRDWLI